MKSTNTTPDPTQPQAEGQTFEQTLKRHTHYDRLGVVTVELPLDTLVHLHNSEATKREREAVRRFAELINSHIEGKDWTNPNSWSQIVHLIDNQIAALDKEGEDHEER